MNMMNTRSEIRFVRKDIAIAVALVISSLGAAQLAFAQSDAGAVTNTDEVPDTVGSTNALPTLVDPAGIIDPELLSLLNGLSDTTDLSNSEFSDENLEQLVDREVAHEPELAAAKPVFEKAKTSEIAGDANPSIFDPPAALQENGLLADKNSSELRKIEQVAEIESTDDELSEKPAQIDGSSVSITSIDPHLPPPELPEIVLTDEPLPTLRFTDMLALALADNPSIIMAEERVIQAIEQSNQVGAFRYPSIAMTGTVGPESNKPVASEDSGVAETLGQNVKFTVTHLLYDGGTAKSNFIRSNRLISAAEAESQIELESLLLEIVVHYVDYWRYQVVLSEAENFVAVMNDLVDRLNSMFKAGATSKLEVDFARARVASARGAESEAAASRNNAFSELEFLVPGLSKFIANSPEKFSDFTLLSLDDYLEKGAASNSGFITNQMNIEASELKVRAAKGAFKPTVNVELSGSYIKDEGQETPQARNKYAAKFLLNYIFYSGGERRAAVRRAHSQLRELRSERVLLERDVFREIDQSFNNITASRLALDAVNDEIIAHKELQRLNRQNLALGTVNIMELIDVEERLFNASSRQYEVLATMYQEYFTLLVSAGYTAEILAKYELELASNQGY
jgi:multidrug efflux system outer membrane protein